MILALDLGNFALVAVVVVVGDAVVTYAISKQLKRISAVLESRHALIVPDELGPEDRIVVWHKDEQPPDDEPPKRDNGPIVGLG